MEIIITFPSFFVSQSLSISLRYCISCTLHLPPSPAGPRSQPSAPDRPPTHKSSSSPNCSLVARLQAVRVSVFSASRPSLSLGYRGSWYPEPQRLAVPSVPPSHARTVEESAKHHPRPPLSAWFVVVVVVGCGVGQGTARRNRIDQPVHVCACVRACTRSQNKHKHLTLSHHYWPCKRRKKKLFFTHTL